MPTTDWNDKPVSDDAWLRAQTAKPAPRMGACLWCGAPKCGCHQDDVFGPQRDKINPKDADAKQPMLRIVEREDA